MSRTFDDINCQIKSKFFRSNSSIQIDRAEWEMAIK